MTKPLTRRTSLKVGAALIVPASLVSCSDDDASTGTGAGSGSGASGSGASGTGASGSGGSGAGGNSGGGGSGGVGGSGGQGGGAGTCVLMPQQTEGPYYLEDDLLRADITEGKPGVPLEVVVIVRRISDCEPLVGVPVDIWSCDARGVYSGYPGQLGGEDTTGETYMRGTQLTDNVGVATFTSIYPGWYPGRSVHIHFKVHPTAMTEVTSQLYFPEAVTTEVMAVAPYSDHGPSQTSNAEDGIFANTNNADRLVAAMEATADGWRATIDVTIAG